MHEVLVNRLGGLSLPRKSVVRLTDRLDMTTDVYRGRKTTTTTKLRIDCAGVQAGMSFCWLRISSKTSFLMTVDDLVLKY